MDAIHRCFELGESVKSVSEEMGYTRASIYIWRKRYLQGGTAALINDKYIKPGTLTEGSMDPSPDLAQLQAQIRDMQMEIDILKETISVLKKDPDIDRKALKNREKAALKDKYSLPELMAQLGLSKSSYYYQGTVMKRHDKYTDI